MAKKASSKPKAKKRSSGPRPKPRVMQGALLMWAHRIFHSADDAVKAAGGYANLHKNEDQAQKYFDILELLRSTAATLDGLAGKEPPKRQVRGGCDEDDDCPDDQVCRNYSCEPLYPQE